MKRTGRLAAVSALPLALVVAIGASVGAGACARNLPSCFETETCETPEPEGAGGQGGQDAGQSDPSCIDDPGGCSEHATCETVENVSSCTCKDGYEGDGHVCHDVDECAEDGGPCHESATCVNTPGSFECTCDDGFFGPGTICWPLTDLVSSGGDGVEVSLAEFFSPALSANGQVIAYTIRAPVPDSSSAQEQVFLRDYGTGTNAPISVKADGSAGRGHHPSISADGNLVLFNSNSGDLAGEQGLGPAIYLRDRSRATTLYITPATGHRGGRSYTSSLSLDGRYAAFFRDGLRVKNLLTGVETGAPLNQDLREVEAQHARMSANGRYVAFFSSSVRLGASNGMRQIHVHDLLMERTTLASVSPSAKPADAACNHPNLSGAGRFVAFISAATNLSDLPTNGHSQIFVRDLVAGTTHLASVNSVGEPGDASSIKPSLSEDGRFVVFSSEATNLVSGDTNDVNDVFVRDLVEGTTIRVSVSSLGEQADAPSHSPAISADGRLVAFVSEATNLTPGLTGSRQVFRRVFRPE